MRRLAGTDERSFIILKANRKGLGMSTPRKIPTATTPRHVPAGGGSTPRVAPGGGAVAAEPAGGEKPKLAARTSLRNRKNTAPSVAPPAPIIPGDDEKKTEAPPGTPPSSAPPSPPDSARGEVPLLLMPPPDGPLPSLPPSPPESDRSSERPPSVSAIEPPTEPPPDGESLPTATFDAAPPEAVPKPEPTLAAPSEATPPATTAETAESGATATPAPVAAPSVDKAVTEADATVMVATAETPVNAKIDKKVPADTAAADTKVFEAKAAAEARAAVEAKAVAEAKAAAETKAAAEATLVLSNLKELSASLMMLVGEKRNEAFRILSAISEAWNRADLAIAKKRKAEEAAAKKAAAEAEKQRKVDEAAKKAAAKEVARKVAEEDAMKKAEEAVAAAMAAEEALREAAKEAAEARKAEEAVAQAAAAVSGAPATAAVVEAIRVSGDIAAPGHSVLSSVAAAGPTAENSASENTPAPAPARTAPLAPPVPLIPALPTRAANPYLVEKALCVRWNENPVRMKDLFHEWDVDASGLIDKDEFRSACTGLGIIGGADGISHADVDGLFQMWDVDGSGEIDFEELSDAIKAAVKAEKAARKAATLVLKTEEIKAAEVSSSLTEQTWKRVCMRTDELFEVVEKLRPAFSKSLKELLTEEQLPAELLEHVDLLNPVEVYSHASLHDKGLFPPNSGLEEATVHETISAKMVCTNSAQMAQVAERLLKGYRCEASGMSFQVIRLTNTFADLEPTHFRYYTFSLLLEHNNVNGYAELQLHHADIRKYHEEQNAALHYDYFRSRVSTGTGEESDAAAHVDETLEKVLSFLIEAAAVPVLLSLLVLVFTTSTSVGEEDLEMLPQSAYELYSMATQSAVVQRLLVMGRIVSAVDGAAAPDAASIAPAEETGEGKRERKQARKSLQGGGDKGWRQGAKLTQSDSAIDLGLSENEIYSIYKTVAKVFALYAQGRQGMSELKQAYVTKDKKVRGPPQRTHCPLLPFTARVSLPQPASCCRSPTPPRSSHHVGRCAL